MMTENSAEWDPERKPERKPKRKRRRKKHYLLRIIIVILLCVGAWIALQHIDYFNITGIAVIGNKDISDEEIIELSEIKTGENLFEVHPLFAQRKIKKSNLYVKEVDIDRKLPDKVEIYVTERTGQAQFAMGKKYVIIDGEGLVLEVAKKKKQVTMVPDLEVKEAETGKTIEVKDETTYNNVMELISITADNDLYFKKIKLEGDDVKAYVYDKLVCKGKYDDVVTCIKSGALKSVLYDLYQKDKKKGTVKIGSNNYCSFTQ